MQGPAPNYQPEFPSDFVEQAQQIVRRPTSTHRDWQRARMVVLLDQNPAMSSPCLAGEVVLDSTTVRRWRKRWAQEEDFSLDDRPGRGRKPKFDGL